MSKDFIGIYENAFSSYYCERAINYFDSMKQNGFTMYRQQTENIKKTSKDDEFLFNHDEDFINLQGAGSLHREFNTIFWEKYQDYADEYDILKTSPEHNNFSFKIQKTKIGGGYHMWHCESAGRSLCHRILVWLLYLNDVEEGGETEFLYYHKRIKPKAGTLLIWPAAFTHTHRGNPPLSNEKYIITGWTEF
jgi:hypothetical protein